MSEQSTEKKYRILKAKLDVNDDYFAKLLKFKSAASFRSSTARDRFVEAIVNFYEHVKEPLE